MSTINKIYLARNNNNQISSSIGAIICLYGTINGFNSFTIDIN